MMLIRCQVAAGATKLKLACLRRGGVVVLSEIEKERNYKNESEPSKNSVLIADRPSSATRSRTLAVKKRTRVKLGVAFNNRQMNVTPRFSGRLQVRKSLQVRRHFDRNPAIPNAGIPDFRFLTLKSPKWPPLPEKRPGKGFTVHSVSRLTRQRVLERVRRDALCRAGVGCLGTHGKSAGEKGGWEGNPARRKGESVLKP